MAESLIEVKDLIKSFDAGRPWMGQIFAWSVAAFLPSSAERLRKTTLLRHLIGVIRPHCGQILVGGEDITTFDENGTDGYRRRFGMLFQMGALFEFLKVHDNMLFRSGSTRNWTKKSSVS